MYLNHDEILELCESGYMKDWDKDCINAASLDVRLGSEILEEIDGITLNYAQRDKPNMHSININKGFVMYPGQFILAHTIEKCNLPDDIAALFRIKSSMGRIGLEHMDAGWVDPGFNGSLTLEFKLMMERHRVVLKTGDRIGQLIFFRGKKVSEDKSYRAVGNYNGSNSVVQVGYQA